MATKTPAIPKTVAGLRAELLPMIEKQAAHIEALENFVQKKGPLYLADPKPITVKPIIDAPEPATRPKRLIYEGIGYLPGDVRPDGRTLLDDYTWSVPVPNVMPVPGPEWGVGAVVTRKDLPSMHPHTVTALAGTWGVRAEFTDERNNHSTIELPIDQLDLLQRAPGT